MILRGVLPREVPQRVANLAWTSSKKQKIRMLGKSILVTVAVVDHVRGGGGPSGASFDGFQSIQSAKTRITKILRISGTRMEFQKSFKLYSRV